MTVIIVSYNTREMTLECLHSLYIESPDLRLQTIVVDNASDDGSAKAIADQFPSVELYALEENEGFGRANNRAAQHAKAEWLLLLNPDTVVLRRGVERMLEFARSQQGACLIGGRTYFADGSLNPTSCWGEPTLWSVFCTGTGLSSVFRRNAFFDPESLGKWPRDDVREVEIIAGCVLMIPREFFAELGGFDTGFFMYSEDVDLSMRARRLGARCLICPDAEIVHHAGASEPVRADKMVRLLVAKSQLFKKHWPSWKSWIALRMLDAWCLSRTLFFGAIRWLGEKRRNSYRDWKAIWKRRREWHEVAAPGTDPEPEGSTLTPSSDPPTAKHPRHEPAETPDG